MKTLIRNFSLLAILLIALSLSFSACSKKIYRDDAVRIKDEKTNQYNILKKTQTPRNGNTLRGEVIKIHFDALPDSCPITENTKYSYKGYVLFIDSSVSKKRSIERIPLEDIDLVGPKIAMEMNEHNNINYFETYNNPFLPLQLRAVPVDTLFKDTCITPCPCEPINLDLELPCIFCLDCPDRQLGNWFLEVKPGYSIYNDFNSQGQIAGKDDWLVDVAAGFRFGKTKRWGLGVIVSSGVESFNVFDSTFSKRPSVNLYGRYELIREKKRITTNQTLLDSILVSEAMILYDTIRTKTEVCCDDSTIVITRLNPNYLINIKNIENVEETEVRPCLSPFVYGLLGVSIDKLSIDLMKLNFSDCKTQVPDVDISLPINFGFGIGLEIPISKSMDFSTDLGFRSISFANRTVSNGLLTPVSNRTNSLVFRIGITF